MTEVAETHESAVQAIAAPGLRITDAISKFDGSGSFSVWATRFERLSSTLGISHSRAALMPALLEGEALDSFLLIPVEECSGWDDVKKAMRERFDVGPMEAFRQAISIKASEFKTPEGRGRLVDCSLAQSKGPKVQIQVDGVERTALVDTGTINGERNRSRCGAAVVIRTSNGCSARVEALCIDSLPGVEVLLVWDAIKQFGGLMVSPSGEVSFGGSGKPTSAWIAQNQGPITVKDQDFSATFNEGEWT
ncbi:hypothetical protein Ciccas_009053, partial [Cichlidogyrus casuarinus]